MRWFLKLSQVSTKAGIRQTQADICIFTYSPNHLLDGILLAHVDDLLFTGSKSFITLVINALKAFRTGDLETLTTQAPIIFTGMLIEKKADGAILPPHQHYVQELPTMNIEHCIGDNQITDASDLRSTFRQGLGSLIWAHQTRPDVGFTITQIATDSKSGPITRARRERDLS